MRRLWFRLAVFILMLAAMDIVAAQDVTTVRTNSGYLVDMPADWNTELPDDDDSTVLFDDGAMFGVIIMFNANTMTGGSVGVMEDLVDSISADDDGVFDSIESYTINEQWDAARTTRIRRSDRAYEVLIVAEVRQIGVILRADFRVGAQQDYLPMFDTMISTVQLEGQADAPSTDNDVFVGTVSDPLNLGALDANYVTADQDLQFNYPSSWEITDNEDGSFRFINREGVTLFGTLRIGRADDATPEALLDTALTDEDGFSEIEVFSMNGLPTARAYRENVRGASTDIAMATVRGDVTSVIQATASTEDLGQVEPILRGVLYSVRSTGADLGDPIIGAAAREGLVSGQIFGVQRVSNIALEGRYVTDDQRYAFSYPADWTIGNLDEDVLISNVSRFRFLEVESGDVQLVLYFLDNIGGLDIPEYSPHDLLQYVIDNGSIVGNWSEINDGQSVDRRLSWADIEPQDFEGLALRSYFLELDADEQIYVRIDLLTQIGETEAFEDVTLAIIDTIDFAD